MNRDDSKMPPFSRINTAARDMVIQGAGDYENGPINTDQSINIYLSMKESWERVRDGIIDTDRDEWTI